MSKFLPIIFLCAISVSTIRANDLDSIKVKCHQLIDLTKMSIDAIGETKIWSYNIYSSDTIVVEPKSYNGFDWTYFVVPETEEGMYNDFIKYLDCAHFTDDFYPPFDYDFEDEADKAIINSVKSFVPIENKIRKIGYVLKNGEFVDHNEDMSIEDNMDSVRFELSYLWPGKIVKFTLNKDNPDFRLDSVSYRLEKLDNGIVRLTMQNLKYDFAGVYKKRLITAISISKDGKRTENTGMTAYFYPNIHGYKNYVNNISQYLLRVKEQIDSMSTEDQLKTLIEGAVVWVKKQNLDVLESDKIVFEYNKSSGVVELYYRSSPENRKIVLTKKITRFEYDNWN